MKENLYVPLISKLSRKHTTLYAYHALIKKYVVKGLP